MHMAFLHLPDRPREYVQDKTRGASVPFIGLLKDGSCIDLCGLKGMEADVMVTQHWVCAGAGLDWPTLHAQMVTQGRFHVETY